MFGEADRSRYMKKLTGNSLKVLVIVGWAFWGWCAGIGFITIMEGALCK
jgi:hypothetical protein